VLLEDLRVLEESLLGVAPGLGDGVTSRAAGLGVGNDLAVLDVDTANLTELTSRVGEELGDNGNLLVGVDGEVGTGAVEGLVALTEGVEVATIGVASTGVTLVGVGSTAVVATADVVLVGGARVRSVSGGDGVGLP
jgi:hypothetical protein